MIKLICITKRNLPFFISLSSLSLASSFVFFLFYGIIWPLFFSFFIFIFIIFLWFFSLTREFLIGWEYINIEDSIKFGIILFILSEVCFFLSFFWTFFVNGLSSSSFLGECFPPVGIQPIPPFSVPFLNTIILLSSSLTLTLWHNLFECGKENKSPLIITILLAFYFSYLQFQEYKFASFSISDSSFGSIFFLATGFHGFHVILGTLLLIVVLFRSYIYYTDIFSHPFIEISVWYFHFVDVVWLFLFSFFYWWGG